MSGYFRDRVQGAGAIAANARAPRAAPAPMLRHGVGYVAAGAVRIDDNGGDSGGGGNDPVRGQVRVVRGARPPAKAPAPIAPRQGNPMIPAQPVKPKSLPAMPSSLFEPAAAPVRSRSPAAEPTKARSAATVTELFSEPAPIIPVLVTTKAGTKAAAVVSGGGAAYSPTPKSAPSYGGLLSVPATDDGGGDLEVNATTAVAPKGGAKLWLVLGLGGTAAFLAYRHFSKRKARR